jgi:hypothetical protein
MTGDISNNVFRFRPCFEYKYWDYNQWRTGEVCLTNYYNFTAYLLSEFYEIGFENICCSNDECEADERCASNYVCEELNCGYCQYLSDHACVSWDCCADDDCDDTEYCADNACLPVPCLGQIANHTCVGFIPPILPMLPGSDVVLDAIITFFGDNLILFFFGIVFTIVFIILLIWLFRGHLLPKKGPKDKKDKKEDKKKEDKKKKDKKKKKGEGDKEKPEFVPLVELPE